MNRSNAVRTRVAPAKARWIAAGLLTLAGLAWAPSIFDRAPAAAQAPETLIAYTMTDQWPERGEAAAGIFQSPIDLELAADGTVLVADKGIGGVHRLLPSGVFTTPFGTTGGLPAQLAEVGQMSLGPDPAGAGELVYVIDPSADRLVIYDTEGAYQRHWDGIRARSVAASDDGRVYVLDTEASAVRALNASDGSERFRFGERGTEDGRFTNFIDVDVSEDGRFLAVADQNTLRVQLFDLATDAEIDGGAEPMRLRDVHNLTEGRFSDKAGSICRASRINAMGGDRIFVGEGEQACLIEGREVLAAIATTANQGTICRSSVRLPRLRPGGAQFFALASYDPNAGPCTNKRGELDTHDVIVRYNDERLRAVRTVWDAAGEDDVTGRLFAPQELTIPAEGQVFVRDNSPYMRFYGSDGQLQASISRDTSGKDLGTEFEVTFLGRAVGSEALGEVYAQYSKYRKGNGGWTAEMGVGRFRATEERTRQGPEDIIEPIWTRAYASGGKDGSSTEVINIAGLAWNYDSGELLALQERIVEQQQLYTLQIARFSPDGRELKPPIDLPRDGDYNPFSDIAVGPDGRIYLLDDLHDFVLILAADGSVEQEVPVAQDARGVAGGPASPEGSIFVLREHGAIERVADDGQVSARLDGRALPFSDPTYISDLVVDAAGKVYVADGQASLISVFEATEDSTVLPLPEDGACAFLGQKTAAPQVVELGRTVTLELLLSGSCGVNEAPTDIVVVVPYPGKLQRGKDRSRASLDALLDLGRRLDFARHRIGIVGYYQVNSVEQALTGDRDTYIDAVLNIQRFDPTTKAPPNLKKAMETGDTLFEPELGRRQVMVLLSALYCDPNNARKPADCSGWTSADETAQAIRDAGTQIIVAMGQSAANLASSDEDVVGNAGETHRRMVDYRLPDLTAADITILDELPANMRVVEASIGAGGVWVEPSIRWQQAEMIHEPIGVSVEVEPLEAGRWPTNVQAYAELTDGWGQPHRIDFPVPEVEVVAPTPEPGTATLTPVPSATATPTATSVPGTVYLPWLGRSHCWPKNAALDLVLVLDSSSSMQGEKLRAARAAIRSFLDLARLEPGADRVALVTFDGEARTLQGMTSDSALLDTALDGMQTGLGTRIDLGLGEAIAMLDADKRSVAALPVVILLSDGRQGEDLALALAKGDAARNAGYEVYTIGLGEDADGALLAQLATTPDKFLPAPSEADLAAIYGTIAGRLVGCP